MDKRNKILIVDDSEINRSLLADMLSGEYSLMEASDGLEAVALISIIRNCPWCCWILLCRKWTGLRCLRP